MSRLNRRYSSLCTLIGLLFMLFLSTALTPVPLLASSFKQIDDPNAGTGPNQGTIVSGVNNAGVLVGSYGDATGGHGFMWQKGKYTTFDVPKAGTTSKYATRLIAINNHLLTL